MLIVKIYALFTWAMMIGILVWHVSTLSPYVHPTNPIATPEAVEDLNMTSGVPKTPFVPSRSSMTPSVASEEQCHE